MLPLFAGGLGLLLLIGSLAATWLREGAVGTRRDAGWAKAASASEAAVPTATSQCEQTSGGHAACAPLRPLSPPYGRLAIFSSLPSAPA